MRTETGSTKWVAARVQLRTAKGAKFVLDPLPPSKDQRRAANAFEPCANSNSNLRLSSFCEEGLQVTNLEAGRENKCASPYIGQRFDENSVGGKWLMGA